MAAMFIINVAGMKIRQSGNHSVISTGLMIRANNEETILVSPHKEMEYLLFGDMKELKAL